MMLGKSREHPKFKTRGKKNGNSERVERLFVGQEYTSIVTTCPTLLCALNALSYETPFRFFSSDQYYPAHSSPYHLLHFRATKVTLIKATQQHKLMVETYLMLFCIIAA
jgi:hypothetical protein